MKGCCLLACWAMRDPKHVRRLACCTGVRLPQRQAAVLYESQGTAPCAAASVVAASRVVRGGWRGGSGPGCRWCSRRGSVEQVKGWGRCARYKYSWDDSRA